VNVGGALIFIAMALVAGCSGGSQREQAGTTGNALFLRHCAGCHPDGKNLIYPQKDLHRMTLAANGITQPKDIVAVMRNPGKGMTRFDRTLIPDAEAFLIATYVMETFR
jgi:cytochrome c6